MTIVKLTYHLSSILIAFCVGFFLMRILPGWINFGSPKVRHAIQVVLNIAGLFFIIKAVILFYRCL